MRTHSVKAMLAKVVGIGVLAGVAAVAMPQRAEAQSFAVGRMWGERVGREAILKHADELRKRGVAL